MSRKAKTPAKLTPKASTPKTKASTPKNKSVFVGPMLQGTQPAPPRYLGGAVPTDDASPPRNAKFLGDRPALVENIDPAIIGQLSGTEGARSLGALETAFTPFFNTLAQQQRDQINSLSSQLNNQYTADARSAATASLADSQAAAAAGQMLANQAAQAMQASGPTEIEQETYRQGLAELGLGRSLSPEQMRDAQQSARQAFAARGLGTGLGAASAELLNRDRFASQREAERRQFASAANQMREQNTMARRQGGGQLASLGGNLLGQSAASRQRGGLMMTEIDPFARAIAPAMALGQSAQQFGLNTAGNQFNRALDLFGGASSFNVNRMDNLRTNWMDNTAAIRGANIQANAQAQAAQAQAAATRAARPTWWETTLASGNRLFSDKRMKTDVKPLGKAGNVLGLTAYEFRYKGDKKKHMGFMAQAVQKVLPEAVEEVDYKGKKRLTIKPMVIGAALAQELMTAKAA